MPFQVVLDTCVLVQLPLRDEFGHSAERALTARRGIERAFEDGVVPAARVDALVPAMSNPEHDRHVLAAAAAVNAAKIVTENVKDFSADACEPHGVEALTPDEFLLDLFAIHGVGMRDVLRQQAARLRNPPFTVDDILDRLARSAPRFADALRTP